VKVVLNCGRSADEREDMADCADVARDGESGGRMRAGARRPSKWMDAAACAEYDGSGAVNAMSRRMYEHLDSTLTRIRFERYLAGGAVVADFGCGPAHVLALLAPKCKTVYAIDSSQHMLARARANIEAADVEGLEFKGAQFDLEEGDEAALRNIVPERESEIAICSLTAHHVRDIAALHGLIVRTVAPGGIVVYFDKMQSSDSEHPGAGSRIIPEHEELHKTVRHSHGLSKSTFQALAAESRCELMYCEPDLTYDFGREGAALPILAVYMRRS